MKIDEIRRVAIDRGCKIIEEQAFSLVASCNDDKITIIKNPESRIKVLVASPKLDDINDIIKLPSKIEPHTIKIGSFQKQGSWSHILKLGNLDRINFIFQEKDVEKLTSKKYTNPMNRINRANNFTSIMPDKTIDPFKIIKNEVHSIGDEITKEIENSISSTTNDNVICGFKPTFQKSWNKLENEKYHFMIQVSCKVPVLMDNITKKLETVGGWRLMSESDLLYIKSVIPPSKDSFLTGIKLKSIHGKNQFEFELLDDKNIKKKDFFDKLLEINTQKETISVTEEIDIKKMLPRFAEMTQ